jgi:hypothetical protein
MDGFSHGLLVCARATSSRVPLARSHLRTSSRHSSAMPVIIRDMVLLLYEFYSDVKFAQPFRSFLKVLYAAGSVHSRPIKTSISASSISLRAKKKWCFNNRVHKQNLENVPFLLKKTTDCFGPCSLIFKSI